MLREETVAADLWATLICHDWCFPSVTAKQSGSNSFTRQFLLQPQPEFSTVKPSQLRLGVKWLRKEHSYLWVCSQWPPQAPLCMADRLRCCFQPNTEQSVHTFELTGMYEMLLPDPLLKVVSSQGCCRSRKWLFLWSALGATDSLNWSVTFSKLWQENKAK